MAFDLKNNNLSGLSIVDQPGGLIATNENFIDVYDYVTQYQPELIPDLHYANGKGSIAAFLRAVSKEDTYASDTIQHKEIGRLHNVLKNVVFSGTTTFTSPTPHNLRPNMVVKISDGVVERQATVTSITSPTVFEATNDAVGVFGFSGNVTVLADFSNRFEKGSSPFQSGRNWDSKTFVNYTHILKETYDVSESNMAHKIWVNTPYGPRWFNQEMERTSTLFDNLGEMTAITHTRVEDGSDTDVLGLPKGMKGVVQQIEERGNVANDYIQTVDDLSDIAFRLKQQGGCREVTVWADHDQMRFFRILAAGVNSAFLNGAHYGIFQNSKEMALSLDFSSITVEGVTFHFTPWKLLDDPTLLGATNFKATSFGYLIVPAGLTTVMENGSKYDKPYLSLRYRIDGDVNRKRTIKIFGINGTPQRDDKMTADFLTEMTNQVIGANNFFVGRRSDSYYS